MARQAIGNEILQIDFASTIRINSSYIHNQNVETWGPPKENDPGRYQMLVTAERFWQPLIKEGIECICLTKKKKCTFSKEI